MDCVDFIIEFESGTLSHDEIIAGFQKMIDDGTVWSLQGYYGRTAKALIEAGYCTATPAKISKEMVGMTASVVITDEEEV